MNERSLGLPEAASSAEASGQREASAGVNAAERRSAPTAPEGSFQTSDLLLSRARTQSLSGLPRLVAGEPLERDVLARNLIIVAAIRISLVTIALVVLFVLTQLRLRELERVPSWQYALVGLAYALSLSYVVLLRAPLLARPLAYAQIGLDALIVSTLVVMTGGVESVFTFGYIFPVLSAASTLYRRGTIVATAVSCFSLGAILSVHHVGQLELLPAVPFGASLFSFGVYCLGMGLVGVLASALVEKARVTGRELVKSQAELEQLEMLHAAILRSLPAGLVTIDVSGVIQFANEAAQQILQRQREELVGRSIQTAVEPIGRHWKARQAIQGTEGLRERFEETLVRPDGKGIRLGFSFAPLGGPTERWLGSIVVFQDLTDIVRLKEAVERSERLATLGRLAAGLAHEVRNPLASMCASIEVLRQSLDPPASMQRLMANVVREGERLNGLITDFLAFARPRPLELARLELGALVAEVVELFRHEARRDSLEVHLSRSSPAEVVIDPGLVKQVLWNLLRNAAEAMRGQQGDLRVGVEVEVCVEDRAGILRVKDQGPGIGPDQRRRIFEPFFTTKAGGSGLGLAISHSIVAAHGAQIGVESRLGEGTVFTVRFPLAPASPLLEEAASASAAAMRERGGALDEVRTTRERGAALDEVAAERAQEAAHDEEHATRELRDASDDAAAGVDLSVSPSAEATPTGV